MPKGERSRNRKLDDAELRAIWAHADVAGDYGAFIQLLLLTTQRHDKINDLQWDDVSPEGIIAANSLKSPYSLTAGQSLQIP